MALVNSPFDMTADFDFTEGMASSPVFPPFDVAATSNISFEEPSFEPVNSPADNIQTVSPKDIVMDINFSAPPSAAMTNLSTPQTLTWDSPFDGYHSKNTSPNLFNDEELDLESHNWTSLFPEESTTDVKPSIEAGSPDTSTSPSASNMGRTHSSPGGRLSSTSGVKKPRSRNKPLAELNPDDEENPAAKKRMRNTMAARKSRDKRAKERDAHVEKIEQLEHELNETKKELERYKGFYKQVAASGLPLNGIRPQ